MPKLPKTTKPAPLPRCVQRLAKEWEKDETPHAERWSDTGPYIIRPCDGLPNAGER